MSCYMPPEIVINILKRLDAKTLICFSSVSKYWFSFITSREFISEHLNHALQESRIIKTSITSCTCDFSVMDERCVLRNNEEDARIPRFMVPRDLMNRIPRENQGEFNIIGSINGLVCIVVDNVDTNIQSIILWNPSIRKFISLPPHALKRSLRRNMALVGFGAHFVNGDYEYKVVRVLFPMTKSFARIRVARIPDAEVYSIRDKAWRRVKGIDIECRAFEFLHNPTFASQATHWIVFKPGQLLHENKPFILAFSFGDELVKEIALPDPLGDDFEGCSHLIRVRDHLAVAKYAVRDSLRLNIWIMKEYGIKESWTRVYDFDVIRDMWHVLPSNGFVKFLVPPPEDENDEDMMRKDNIMKPINWPMSFRFRDFVESIVFLGGHERVLELDDGMCAPRISENREGNGDQPESSNKRSRKRKM